mmetsp:Transcript_79928/g.226084  ORF Transcript_79928/g.226084 Transcript_79928/m.226084 type:complete len:261 (+) Transcript_79928:796-1578(+)
MGSAQGAGGPSRRTGCGPERRLSPGTSGPGAAPLLPSPRKRAAPGMRAAPRRPRRRTRRGPPRGPPAPRGRAAGHPRASAAEARRRRRGPAQTARAGPGSAAAPGRPPGWLAWHCRSCPGCPPLHLRRAAARHPTQCPHRHPCCRAGHLAAAAPKPQHPARQLEWPRSWQQDGEAGGSPHSSTSRREPERTDCPAMSGPLQATAARPSCNSPPGTAAGPSRRWAVLPWRPAAFSVRSDEHAREMPARGAPPRPSHRRASP